MGTIRDLRDFINVSRLEYHSDDEDEIDYNNDLKNENLNNKKKLVYAFNINHDKQLSSSNGSSNGVIENNKTNLKPNQLQPKESVFKPTNSTTSKTTPIRSSVAGSKDYLLLNRTSIPRLSTVNSINRSIVDNNLDKVNLINNYKIETVNTTNTNNSSVTKSLIISNLNNYYNDNANSSDKNECIDDDIIVEGNFDQMLIYIDASIVSDWLNRSNKELQQMFIWLEESKCESFIHFSNFWLTKMNDKQRRDIITVEYSIIVDEISHAFLVGIEADKIDSGDIRKLLKAVFKEYPLVLLSFRGLYLMLDYIDVLCSDRQDAYKKLLSDVKCRTLNKQYAQWLLSIRSFALINMCSAVIKFFKKATTEPTVVEILRAKSAPASSSRNRGDKTKISNKVSPQSIEIPIVATSIDLKYKYYKEAVFKFDYPEVLHYLIVTKKLDPMQTDEHNRNLVFLAVMNVQPKILNYLIKRWPQISVNEPCDTGNTPLHAAANNGKLNIVEILLKSKNLDLNATNKSCMDATALHLATWHSHDDIAILLVRNKADPYLKMSTGSNAIDLAKENNNEVLAELLAEFFIDKDNFVIGSNNSSTTTTTSTTTATINNNIKTDKIVDKS